MKKKMARLPENKSSLGEAPCCMMNECVFTASGSYCTSGRGVGDDINNSDDTCIQYEAQNQEQTSKPS